MTNSESVYDNRLMACKIFAERNATYRWIDGMKLIVLTTIPDILSFLTTKPGHTRCQFARGKSHTSNGQGKSDVTENIRVTNT